MVKCACCNENIMYKGLPIFCYSTLLSTGKTIVIKRGEMGYYPAKSQNSADELNKELGITKAQSEAMLVGSIFGWHVKGANPNIYDENGIPKKEI